MAESADRDSGDEDDRDAGVGGTDLLQDIQAGLIRKSQIEKNNVRRLGCDALQTLRTRMCNLDPVSAEQGRRGAPSRVATRDRHR